MLTSLFLGLNIISQYIFCIIPILLIFIPFDFKLNTISGPKLTKFLASVKNSSSRTNDEADGWICGKWYIGFISTKSGQQGYTNTELCLFSTMKFYNIICCNNIMNENNNTSIKEDNKIEKPKMINFWERQGTFWHPYYTKRLYNPILKKIWVSQENIVNKMICIYEEKSYVSALICGPPNKGKSFIPLYLCKKLQETYDEINLVDTWNPTEPGDTFISIYNKINPTKNSPLILVLDEIDLIIYALHNKTIKLMDTLPIPIQIKDKKDWNQFFDRFDRMLYQNVFIIMTSNNNIHYFDNMDTSYMRKNRVDLKIDL